MRKADEEGGVSLSNRPRENHVLVDFLLQVQLEEKNVLNPLCAPYPPGLRNSPRCSGGLGTARPPQATCGGWTAGPRAPGAPLRSVLGPQTRAASITTGLWPSVLFKKSYHLCLCCPASISGGQTKMQPLPRLRSEIEEREWLSLKWIRTPPWKVAWAVHVGRREARAGIPWAGSRPGSCQHPSGSSTPEASRFS